MRSDFLYGYIREVVISNAVLSLVHIFRFQLRQRGQVCLFVLSSYGERLPTNKHPFRLSQQLKCNYGFTIAKITMMINNTVGISLKNLKNVLE